MNIDDLVGKVREYNPAADVATLQRAYEFSARGAPAASGAQSGEPYLVHPLEVAGIIAELRLDVPSVVDRPAARHRRGHARDARRRSRRASATRSRRSSTASPRSARSTSPAARRSRRRTSARCSSRWRATSASSWSSSPTAPTTCARSTHLAPERQARDRAGDARHLRAARAPPRHLLDQERARGQRAPLPAPRGLLPAQAQRREEEGRARAVHQARSSRVLDQEARRGRASRPRSPGGRSTSTRSTRRCSAQNLLYDQIYDLVAFRVIVDSVTRVLRGARRRARQLEAGAGALQGLHRAAEGEHVPVAAHHGDRPVRRAHRGPDPHPRDAPRRRGRHRRALELQGAGEAGERRRDAALRLAAPAARVAAAVSRTRRSSCAR